MKRFLITLIATALALPGAEKKKNPKPPDVQVVECKAARVDGNVVLDGRVLNASEKPLRGLTIVFNFLATGKAVITTQKAQMDEPILEPGKESVFHAVLVDPVRAVYYQIEAVDGSGKDLRVANAGPYTIE